MIKPGKNCCVLSGAFDEIYVRNWQCDDEMSDTSTAPVQNKVIKQYIDNALKNIPELSDVRADVEEIKKGLEEINRSGLDMIYF